MVKYMTIQELYDWAKEHNCVNVTIAKHVNMDFNDVTTVVHLNNEFPNIYSGDNDKVVLD